MERWTIRPSTLGLPWLCAAFCFPSACTNNTGLHYASLHIEARNSAGDPATIDPPDNCTTLPVLRGSRVRNSVTVDGALQLRVDATRDSVVVRRADDSAEVLREISIEDLENGHSETVSVQTDAGQGYEVELMSSCPNTSDTEG